MKPSILFSPLLIATFLATATSALAQQKLAPGLWEQSMTMSGGGMGEMQAQMQKEMAGMPPEQRKQMEAMMAQSGISMGGAGKPMVIKLCITPEQAARDEMPQSDGKCKHTRTSRNGNTIKFAFTCEGGTSGEGEYTLTSPKAHSGKMVMTTVQKGKSERVEMQQSGRWLAADCGALKPR